MTTLGAGKFRVQVLVEILVQIKPFCSCISRNVSPFSHRSIEMSLLCITTATRFGPFYRTYKKIRYIKT
jgi:hypothetical protein